MYSTRCFIAIPVLAPALGTSLRLISQLKNRVDNVKWTREVDMHITLKFLGDIDNRELVGISQALREMCASVEPFVASLDGIGTFPRGKPPRIIWAGIREGADVLGSLYKQLDEALIGLGVPQEARAYSPHLTLGRVGRGADLERLDQELKRVAPEMKTSFDVNEVIIYASLRERGGNVYEPLDRIELS